MGRSLTVIDDLSIDERKYLFDKTKRLKKAIQEDDQKIVDIIYVVCRSWEVSDQPSISTPYSHLRWILLLVKQECHRDFLLKQLALLCESIEDRKSVV